MTATNSAAAVATTPTPPPTPESASPSTDYEAVLAHLSSEQLVALEYELWQEWEFVQREYARRGYLRQPALRPEVRS